MFTLDLPVQYISYYIFKTGVECVFVPGKPEKRGGGTGVGQVRHVSKRGWGFRAEEKGRQRSHCLTMCSRVSMMGGLGGLAAAAIASHTAIVVCVAPTAGCKARRPLNQVPVQVVQSCGRSHRDMIVVVQPFVISCPNSLQEPGSRSTPSAVLEVPTASSRSWASPAIVANASSKSLLSSRR